MKGRRWGRVRPSSRRLVAFILAAGVAIGFGIGWFARACSHPSIEERARREAEEMREKAREFFR